MNGDTLITQLYKTSLEKAVEHRNKLAHNMMWILRFDAHKLGKHQSKDAI